MMVIKERIKIFTDGACKGNPGVGGWGALIKSSYYTKELKGYKQLTTNNRMELIAVIEGIKAIEKNATIEITTDSMYVKNGISQWIDNWRKNDWKTSAKIYFLAGTLSLDEKSNIRLYKSLKSLKRLSTKNVYAKEYYSKLGVKVSNFLKVN